VDMPAVRKIVHDAEKADFRFFDIVLGVVNSDQFRYVEAPDSEAAQAVASLQQQ
jgi:hypothetical protein